MVGVLSLLDTLLAMPMTEIVSKFSIQKDMSEALLSRSGYLGRQLALIEVHEKGDAEAVKIMLAETGFLSLSEFMRMEMEAAAWANRITDAIKQSA